MHRYPKLTATIILLSALTYAKESFIDRDAMHLAHIELSYKYCKNIELNQTLCESKKLTYLDYEDAELSPSLKDIKQHIAPMVKKYKDNNLKTRTLSDIKYFSARLPAQSGNWYNETSIELFAKTATTYTLSTTSSGYTGGAHGYYTKSLDNYSIQTGKKLTLDDLFVSEHNQTLHSVALTHYKKLKGLSLDQPLTDDGWFDDKFILAENFAITPKGLYFFYNQYEIKPYSDGNTEFMLPYNLFKDIIDPKGPLEFALKK